VYLDILSVRFGQRSWIEDLAVHPHRRSQNIGGRLLTAAEDWARRHGATHIELDSSNDRTRAHRFYESRKPTSRSQCFSWTL
jgi:GNAT superfamily N-acetyltransferase